MGKREYKYVDGKLHTKREYGNDVYWFVVTDSEILYLFGRIEALEAENKQLREEIRGLQEKLSDVTMGYESVSAQWDELRTKIREIRDGLKSFGIFNPLERVKQAIDKLTALLGGER